MPIALRMDFDADTCRRAAKGSKDGPQARRLLALAAIYEGSSRSEAARMLLTKALAESFRSELGRAQRAGEAFEIESGLPVSLARKRNTRTPMAAIGALRDSRRGSLRNPATFDYVLTVAGGISSPPRLGRYHCRCDIKRPP